MADGISGFYYDIQKTDPLLKVTLHPNTIREAGEDGKFKKFVKAKGKVEVDDEGYTIPPICSSVMSEDFALTIANSWSETGGDPLSNLWNSFKPLAPYTDFLSDAISGLSSKKEEWESTVNGQSSKQNSALVRSLSWAVDKIKNADLSKATEYLNSALVVQGTRFSFYGGTGISFSNMNMKFTLFSESDNTVRDQLQKILPYAMGHWETLNEDDSKESGIDNLKNFIGFEKPPGGYKANIRSIDNESDTHDIEGTLKLKFGAYYSIRNLVISDVQLNFSRQLVKIPTNPNEMSNTEFTLEPLFCDVQLTLRPAIKYNDTMINHFVLGSSTSEEREKLIQSLSTKLSEYSKKLNNIS